MQPMHMPAIAPPERPGWEGSGSGVAVDEDEAADDVKLDSVAEDVEVIIEYIKIYSAVDSTRPGPVMVAMPGVTMPPDSTDPETTVVFGVVHDLSHIQNP